MPSKSPKQARFMAAVAHNKKFAKRVGVPQPVGRDFNQADKGTGILNKKESIRMKSKLTEKLTEDSKTEEQIYACVKILEKHRETMRSDLAHIGITSGPVWRAAMWGYDASREKLMDMLE